MKRIPSVILGLGIVAALLVPLASHATATAGSDSSATTSVSASRNRQFTATGTLGRYYTKQTVTGVYRNSAGRPLDVTVYDWQDNALLFKHRPALDTAWWGGYWTSSYGLDQWRLGKAGDNTYHLMLPVRPMGSTFQALLVTEFGPNGSNGNWQNWMDGTSS